MYASKQEVREGRGQKGGIKKQKQGCKYLCKDQASSLKIEYVCGDAQEGLSSNSAKAAQLSAM